MEFNGQYLKYDEYQELGGTLSEVPFNLLELKARKIIDNATLNRLVNLENQIQEVKICIFELIKKIDKLESKNISSENIDGYTVNYTTLNEKEIQKVYLDTVRNHLLMCQLPDGTPYMYCGVV